jgi:ATP-dependent DNA ligase
VSFGALLQKRDAHLCVWVFDILAQCGKDLRALPLVARRSKLDKLMGRIQTPIIRYSETLSNPHALLAACDELGCRAHRKPCCGSPKWYKGRDWSPGLYTMWTYF